jgi:hypothetical protein
MQRYPLLWNSSLQETLAEMAAPLYAVITVVGKL